MSRVLLLRLLAALLMASTLAVVFNAYLKPDFIVDIANRLMLCL